MSKPKKQPKTTAAVPTQAQVQTQLLGEIHTLIQSARQRAEYGKGWSAKQLRHCLRFVEIFPQEQKVSALRRQLSWRHLCLLRHQEGTLTGVNFVFAILKLAKQCLANCKISCLRFSMASA